MRWIFSAFAALVTVSAFASGGTTSEPAGLDAQEVFKNGNYRNYDELLQLSAEGRLQTGALRYDSPVLLAKFRKGEFNKAQFWAAAKAANTGTVHDLNALYLSVAPTILNDDTEPAVRTAVLEELNALVSSNDPAARVRGISGLAATYSSRHDWAQAWPWLLQCPDRIPELLIVGREGMRRGAIAPTEVFAGVLDRLADTGGVNAVKAMELFNLALEAANRGEVADAELAAALKRVNRIYSARAVGDDESAKAWGVFVGAVRETLNACE